MPPRIGPEPLVLWACLTSRTDSTTPRMPAGAGLGAWTTGGGAGATGAGGGGKGAACGGFGVLNRFGGFSGFLFARFVVGRAAGARDLVTCSARLLCAQ